MHAEPLPSRLPLLGEGAARWGAVVGVALVAGGVLALRTLGRGPGPGVAGVCFVLGIAMLAVALVRRHGMRKAREIADAMQAGDYIAFWVVPPDVWHAHLARELDAQRGVVGLAAASGFCFAAALAALVVGKGWLDDQDVSGWIAPAVVAVVATTAVFVLVGAAIRVQQGARARRLAGRDGVICIADRGLYHAGELWPHDAGMPVFLGVEMLEGPPRLLAFSYRFSGPKGSRTEVVRVPMPPTDDVIRPDVILSRLSRR
jgi:hypothetical protein